MLRLQTITEDNFTDCLDLKVTLAHRDHADPVVYSLAEAWLEGPDMRPFAIYADDTLIGFVSLYVGENSCQIVNFLIADPHQRRGNGRKALQLCLDYFRSEGQSDTVKLPVHPGNLAALRFWEAMGFARTGREEDGYLWLSRRSFIP